MLKGKLSLGGKQWQLLESDERMCQAMCQRYGLPEVLASLLCRRGVALEDVEGYLSPTLRNLMPDPLHLLDMEKAASRIAQAVTEGETIGIFGDYDVDGATSSALLLRYFGQTGIATALHIPDRQKEGYGPNIGGLKKLREQGATLVITVDTGTVAFAALQQAAEVGIEVVVLDHHQGEANQPIATAIVNPNRLDENSPLSNLAAVGIVFVTLVAVHKKLVASGYFANRPAPSLLAMLDLVALGTVCDVVPLTGLNRAFVQQGLKVMRQRANAGLAALMDVCKLEEPPGVYHLGYVLGPRVNAGGRVGQAKLGALLLSCDDYTQALPMAEQLDQYNRERKSIESHVLEQAKEQAKLRADQPFILVQGEDWHEGVIGIVAGRLKDQYHRPSAVVSWKGDIGKGSARSIKGIDIGQAITAARQAGLLIAGGGHAMAAGFSLTRDHEVAFDEFMQQRLAAAPAEYEQAKMLTIDAALPVSAAVLSLTELLERAGPYGAGNHHPRFCIAEALIVAADVLVSGHVRCVLTDGSQGTARESARLKAMGFNLQETPLGQQLLKAVGRRMNLVGRLQRESWKGRESVTLMLEDGALCDS